MRLATFNLESLDLPPKAGMPLETRAEVLRPALERLDADILCLQEVNGQHVAGREERRQLRARCDHRAQGPRGRRRAQPGHALALSHMRPARAVARSCRPA